jgi:hypothetical protein
MQCMTCRHVQRDPVRSMGLNKTASGKDCGDALYSSLMRALRISTWEFSRLSS